MKKKVKKKTKRLKFKCSQPGCKNVELGSTVTDHVSACSECMKKIFFGYKQFEATTSLKAKKEKQKLKLNKNYYKKARIFFAAERKKLEKTEKILTKEEIRYLRKELYEKADKIGWQIAERAWRRQAYKCVRKKMDFRPRTIRIGKKTYHKFVSKRITRKPWLYYQGRNSYDH